MQAPCLLSRPAESSLPEPIPAEKIDYSRTAPTLGGAAARGTRAETARAPADRPRSAGTVAATPAATRVEPPSSMSSSNIGTAGRTSGTARTARNTKGSPESGAPHGGARHHATSGLGERTVRVRTSGGFDLSTVDPLDSSEHHLRAVVFGRRCRLRLYDGPDPVSKKSILPAKPRAPPRSP